MSSQSSRLAGVLLLALVALNMSHGTATQGRAALPLTSALAHFGEQVAAYATLRQDLDLSLPPAYERPRGVRAMLQARAVLATAIKAARPHARQGDFFSPGVADIFRWTIAEALSGVDSDAFFERLYEGDAVPAGLLPRVHDTFPEWATHEVPLVVLERLPLLPDELDYRLIGQTLVLWDIDADLILDVLPDAIPGLTS
jgi:hypothetical protein